MTAFKLRRFVPMTVLCVEDDAHVLGVLAMMMRAMGLRVLEARDGIEALRKARGEGARVDLLVTDVILPHLNGAELCRRLRTRRPGLGAVLISGLGTDQLGRMFHLPRDARFLHKPFGLESFAAVISSFCPDVVS